MNLLDAMDISAAGMKAQRTRLNVTAANLANIGTTRTVDGGPYRRRDVVFEARPYEPSFADVLEESLETPVSTVAVSAVVEDPRPFQVKYDPSHPDADDRGYVRMPNVEMVEEMVNLISANRAYEANAAVAQASRRMALKALEMMA